MLNTDEDAVVCDLAETYGVFDWRSLPLSTVATFVCGLGQNSRIKRIISDEEFTTEEILLMNIADSLSLLVWLNTTDGEKGINKPKLFAEMLNKKTNDTQAFDSAEEFELKRLAILRGGNNG